MDPGRYLRSCGMIFHCFLFSGSCLPASCLASLHYLPFSCFPESFLQFASLYILHQSHSAPSTIINIQMSPESLSNSSLCQIAAPPASWISLEFSVTWNSKLCLSRKHPNLSQCQLSSQHLSSRGRPSTSHAVNCAALPDF